MKVYLAGKVTGEDYNNVVTKFEAYEQKIKEKGHEVISPVKIVPPTAKWEDAIIMCLKALAKADAVYFLPDWTQSRGARIEYAIAKAKNKKIYFPEQLEEL